MLDEQKKYTKIAEHKRLIYEAYTDKQDHSSKRMKVDPSAHDWMLQKLKDWQQANEKSEIDIPFPNELYLDRRVEAIQHGLLTKAHSETVVKSFLRSHVRKLG